MTLITTIQSVCRQLGLPQPAGAFSETDDMVEQLVALAQEAGDDLTRDHDWSILTVVRDFTGVEDEVQTGEPPTTSVAFDRFAQNTDIWDTGNNWKLIGPHTPREWQSITIRQVGPPTKHWTLIGGVLNIYPAPTTDDTFRYTYITKNWIRLESGDQSSDVSAWTNDSNTSLLPERLIKLSTIWRWKQVKGLGYEEDMATFEREKQRYIAVDRGPRIISTTRMFRDETGLDSFLPWTINEASE